MDELQNLQPSQLVKLLATETITYYKLIGYEASIEECIQCNNRIKKIQLELESRRNPEDGNILRRTEAAEYAI